jgi:hypothetical protein
MSCSVPAATSANYRRHRRNPVRRGRLLLVALFAFLCTPSTSFAELVAYPPADPWYAAPADLGSLPAGQIIRSRQVTLRTAPNLKLPFTTHQVLYRTTDRSGMPNATAATIIVPSKRPPTGRKLVSYQTAYDGLSPACQPSYTLRNGKVALQGAETFLITSLLNRGWTVVTADYEGPNNNWGVAETSARGVLDGIRATEAFAPAGLDEGVRTKVGMVGYSGGGNATAWANEYAPSYAPELNIVGAAQGGVGPNLERVVSALDGELFAGIAWAGIVGVTSGYPEVDLRDYLNKRGQQVYKELKSPRASCITDFVMRWPFQEFRSLLKGDQLGLLRSPPMRAIAAENSLGRFTPKAPMLWYQTYFDQMNGYWLARDVARKYCGEGVKVQFFTSRTEEHAMQAFSMPFKAYDWISERFQEAPVRDTCATV